ncbi:MAG: glycosyltransferase [Cucumibacter sp.]
MKFSVVIPSYNYASMLPDAIDSVLQQRRRDVEIIVGDDASTDKTAGVLGRYGRQIRVFRNETNSGHGPTWAKCIDAAQGEFIVNLDADDWLLPSYFDRAEAGFDAGAGVVVCSNYDFRTPTGTFVERHIAPRDALLEPARFRNRLLRRIFFRSPGMAWRRSLSLANALPRADIWHDDWEYLLRVSRGAAGFLIARPAAVYRIHGASMSQTSLDRLPKIRERIESFARLVAEKANDAYLPKRERRLFMVGLAELYLRIVGTRLALRDLPAAFGHLAYATRLAAAESPELGLVAAGRGLALAMQRVGQSILPSRVINLPAEMLKPVPFAASADSPAVPVDGATPPPSKRS